MSSYSTEIWDLPPSVRPMVESELSGDEKVEWIGQPIPVRMCLRGAPIFVFAIFWTGFSVFWMAGAARFEWPDFQDGFEPMMLFPLFGLPFLLIGFGMMSTPWWVYRAAKKTVYVLTNRRAIVFLGGRSTTITSYYPGELGEMSRRERADGSGDLIFARRLARRSRSMSVEEHGFMAIHEVKRVEDLMRRMIENAPSQE